MKNCINRGPMNCGRVTPQWSSSCNVASIGRCVDICPHGGAAATRKLCCNTVGALRLVSRRKLKSVFFFDIAFVGPGFWAEFWAEFCAEPTKRTGFDCPRAMTMYLKLFFFQFTDIVLAFAWWHLSVGSLQRSALHWNCPTLVSSSRRHAAPLAWLHRTKWKIA